MPRAPDPRGRVGAQHAHTACERRGALGRGHAASGSTARHRARPERPSSPCAARTEDPARLLPASLAVHVRAHGGHGTRLRLRPRAAPSRRAAAARASWTCATALWMAASPRRCCASRSGVDPIRRCIGAAARRSTYAFCAHRTENARASASRSSLLRRSARDSSVGIGRGRPPRRAPAHRLVQLPIRDVAAVTGAGTGQGGRQKASFERTGGAGPT